MRNLTHFRSTAGLTDKGMNGISAPIATTFLLTLCISSASFVMNIANPKWMTSITESTAISGFPPRAIPAIRMEDQAT
jgi:hypothetical protein